MDLNIRDINLKILQIITLLNIFEQLIIVNFEGNNYDKITWNTFVKGSTAQLSISVHI